MSANAGSGKTKVLTDRVARLLLTGVQPQRILCLTYTKAAAAEMQNRLFDRLGEWAMLPTPELIARMTELGAPDIDRETLVRRARTLFARAIEAPGGLKIQTIHALCASLLRRFPLEAGVTPAFEEMEDRQRRELAEDVLDAIASGPDAAVIDAVARLSGTPIVEVALAIASDREPFLPRRGEDEAGRLARTEAELAGALGGGGPTPEEVLSDSDLPAVLEALHLAGGALAKAADAIETARAASAESGFAALAKTVLYASGERSGTPKPVPPLRSVNQREAVAAYQSTIDAFVERVAAALDGTRARAAIDASLALHRFAAVFLAAWDEAKLRRGLLDFGDLIRLTRDLLRDPSVAAWVLYRMDGGIDHILVDEAQDTSPLQWEVIDALTEEFTAGEGAREGTRSLFVVGDPKQSIFGFQGAEPSGFDAREARFRTRFEAAGQPFERIGLRHSFRSSRAILEAVDRALGGREGVGDTLHEAFFDRLPGRVDIWNPPAPPEGGERPDDFSRPVDELPEDAPDILLAKAVVDGIEEMVTAGAAIPNGAGGARAVRPGDVLILLRSRGVLFDEIIRLLKRRDAELRAAGRAGLPVAGADRLKVGDELAVRDLVSLLAFLSLEEDDLSLAEALRSPLLGLGEGDLFDLAHGRDGATLWQRLRAAEDRFPSAVAMLRDLRGQTGFLRPFELLERILVRHGGRLRLLARLGLESAEGIDALLQLALDYERVSVPSLTGFVSWIREDQTEIKREAEAAGDAIRVMTVHGAKGREAPVVIVPQTSAFQGGRGGPVLARIDDVTGWAMPKAAAPRRMREWAEGRSRAEAEEHERLLYVAMTRAESWLILAGAGRVEHDAAWYDMARGGVEGRAHPIEAPTGTGGLRVEFGDLPQRAPIRREPAMGRGERSDLPDLPPSPGRRPPIAPSALGGAKTLPGEEGDPDALARGTHVHLLLEHLPRHPDLSDLDVARDVLGAAEPPAPEDALPDLIAEARRVLDDGRHAALFGEGSRAEVSLVGEVEGLGPVIGSADRVVLGPDEVLIVDYKTNRQVPAAAAEVPEGLLRQLGAYGVLAGAIWPDRTVRTALLWTRDASLVEVPPALRRAALARAITEARGAIDAPGGHP